MKIQNGEEFLEKLGNLDPDLVAEADRPPERASRTVRGWGPGIGAWIAAAACICVLCLPMILRAAFPPAMEGAGTADTTAGGADTSHQLEAAQAEGGTDEGGSEAYTEAEQATGKSAESSQASSSVFRLHDGTPGPISEMVYLGNELQYTITSLEQDYLSGLKGEERTRAYFQFNTKNDDAKDLWDNAYESDFGAEYAYDTAGVLLPSIEGYWASHVFPEFAGPESQLPSRLCFQWDKDGEYMVSGYITVNVVEQPEQIPLQDQEHLREYMQHNDRTLIQQEGLEITTLGGLDTDKTLSFWMNGYFYRIYGDKDADMEAMVQLLNWLAAGDFQLSDYAKDRAVAKERLQDYPDAFAGYYPTDSRWVPRAAKGILEMEGEDTPVSLGLDYGTDQEGHLVTYWIVGTAEYAAEELQYEAVSGTLPELTREDVTGYLEEMRVKGKRYFSFWWDENRKAVFWYREDAADEEIWEFIQYLQSDEVKTERKIGDIVELRPYA